MGMRIGIKCAECGKITRKYDIGGVIYCVGNPSSEIVITNKITCPKYKKDISEGKCIVKRFDFMMRCITANMCLMAKSKVPEHLQMSMPANKEDFEIYKKQYSGRLKIIDG